jgi:hypothetical protein
VAEKFSTQSNREGVTCPHQVSTAHGVERSGGSQTREGEAGVPVRQQSAEGWVRQDR